MLSDFILSYNETLLHALNKLNQLTGGPLVLFIVDENNKLRETLTDGDSRRALINGASIHDCVQNVMNRNFKYLNDKEEHHIEIIRNLKKQKIQLVPILDQESHLIDIIDLHTYKSRLPLDAVLMAGGKGERLRPLTETTPKPLLKIGNKPIIDYNVERLINYGVKDIFVIVNYLKEQIENHFDTLINDIKVRTVTESKFLGTIGGVKFIKEFNNDYILIMNSDLFTNIDFEDFFLHFISNDADMSVAAVPYHVSIPFGILDIEDRNIRKLMEKPQFTYYINGGIYLIKKQWIEEIPTDTFYNATDLIEKLIGDGRKVIRYPLNGTWIDIGNPQEFQKAQDLAKHI